MSRERCDTHIDIYFPLTPRHEDTPKVKVIKKITDPNEFFEAYSDMMGQNRSTGEAHMSVRCVLVSGHTDMPHTFNVGVKFLGKPGAV